MEDQKYKLLIADDEPDIRELYQLKFENETSINIVFAKHGEEAVNLTLQEKPDAILLDIMMPKKSGMEVLKELKSNPNSWEVPIIILTGLPHEAMKEEALKLGAASYLIKSDVTPKEVIDILREELEKR